MCVSQGVAEGLESSQGGETLTTALQHPSRILVVDDEENLRNILVFQLRGEGYEARGVGRGDEALPTALSWKPQLVLLDLMMPGMDGFSVCRTLRSNEETQGLPIIVVTARGDAATRLQALVAGAHEFLVKPYSWEDLLNRIQSVMEISERHGGSVSFVGLPGSADVEAEITRLMNANEDFAFLSLDIDHFRRFNERFGYERGDEVILALTRLVRDLLLEQGGDVCFAGHLGADDLVVLRDPESAQPFAEELIKRFDVEVRGFFEARDVERGFYEIVNRSGRRETVPLPSLTVALVNHVTERDMHQRRLADVAAELRAYGKSRPGSIVVTERRR